MKRVELYLVEHPTKTDPKKQRVVLVVSRQPLIDSNYSTVICAPVYTNYIGCLSSAKLTELKKSLRIALAIE